MKSTVWWQSTESGFNRKEKENRVKRTCLEKAAGQGVLEMYHEDQEKQHRVKEVEGERGRVREQNVYIVGVKSLCLGQISCLWF